MEMQPKFVRHEQANGEEILGQFDFSEAPRYSTPSTFAGLPRVDQVSKFDAGVLGVPFDSGVTYRPGARFGPEQIRAASRLLRPYNFDQDRFPFLAHQVADLGNLAVTPFNLSNAVKVIEAGIASATSEGQKLVLLGGDHTIAYPSLKVLAAKHGPIAVVHFDAHLDTWESYFGSEIHHGAPFRLASEEGLLDPDGCLHVGIRGSVYGRHDFSEDRNLGFSVIPASDFTTTPIQEISERIKQRLEGRNVYVSIDIDVLDPAFAPGTGTPEPGGLSSAQLLYLVRELRDLNVVGADVVEVAPAYDHADVTALAAAHLSYELLSIWATPGAARVE